MEFMFVHTNINGKDNVLEFPSSFSVDQIKNKLRSGYSVGGGFLFADPILEMVVVGELHPGRHYYFRQFTSNVPAAGFDIREGIIRALECAVIIKAENGVSGNGIVVSRDKLLTALHGYFRENERFQIIDSHGNSRNGFVKANWYQENAVDIAVIELFPDATPFTSFMPVNDVPLSLCDDLCMISRRGVGGTDSYTECIEKSHVISIIKDTAIVHATFYAEAGMSGGGIVTVQNPSKGFVLVGVHIANHDKTKVIEGPPPSKKSKTKHVTKEEFDEAMTVNSNIHGQGAYCLICDITRVNGLLELLA